MCIYIYDVYTYIKAQLRQLDGFQARCLRSILGILPAFLSRTSNAVVRQQAGCNSSSASLLERQVIFIGNVVRGGQDTPLSNVSFVPSSFQPATSRYVRHVGRPRREWIPHVLPYAFQAAGGAHHLATAVQSKSVWKRLVHNIF